MRDTVGLLKDKLDTADLGGARAKFLLGIGNEKDWNAGNTKLSQETPTKPY